jgi:hypothetical protein
VQKTILLPVLLFAGAPLAYSQSQTPQAAPPPTETMTRFNADSVTLEWAENRWQLRAGSAWTKDFGRYQWEAREAQRIIRELRLNERVTLGTPGPVLEYWLSDGRAPQGASSRFRTIPFDPEGLRVEEVQGRSCLRDNRRVLFAFGHPEEAHQALRAIREYGFNQVGYIGQPTPVMMYFLADSGTGRGTQMLSPAPIVSRTDKGLHRTGDAATPAADAMATDNPTALGKMPFGRQLSAPMSDIGMRVPFDWRQVQLQHQNGDWKLAAGSYVLADFGPQEQDARQALSVVQYYRFTEHYRIGSPTPAFSFFLASGLPPHGLRFGVTTIPFRPGAMVVQRAREGSYLLADGNRQLLGFEKENDAQQVLLAIQRYHFDHLCRIGAGMTFFVRER